MTLRSQRRKIRDLPAKLRFLADTPEAQEIHGNPSATDLAKAADIPKTTLMNAKNGDGNTIAPQQEAKWATACGFRLDWPEWVTGSAEEFKQRYLREVRPGKAAPQPRRMGAALTPRYGKQEVGSHRLAALKITAVLSNSSERWPIKFGLRCRDFNGLAITMGILDIDCGEAFAHDEDLAFSNETAINGATVRVFVPTEHKPSWRIKATAGILDDVFPDEPCCTVIDVACGDTLTATFSAYIKDVSGPEEYFCTVKDGAAIRRNKKLLMERLAKADLPAPIDGEIVLCRHAVTFEDAYAELRDTGANEGER